MENEKKKRRQELLERINEEFLESTKNEEELIKKKRRKKEKELNFQEFHHQVSLRTIRIKNTYEEEIAKLEKQNHIVQSILSLSSPKLSEAAEKIYLKFSEEKGCWTQEENDKTVKPIKAMDSKEVEDELSRRGFHGFSFEAKRLSEELRTGNTATGRSKADKDAINREILRLARKKGHGIPIITQEILDDVLNNDQDLIKMPPSSQEELDDDEEEEEEIRPPWHERKIMNKKTEEKKVLPILSMPILVGDDQSQNIEPAVNTMLTKTIEDLLCQVDHFEDKIQQEKEKLAKGKSKAIFMQISEYKEEKKDG